MQEEKAKKRKNLIDCAANLFFEKGFLKTTIDEIVSKASCSKRNVYHEFKNKNGLFSAIIDEYTKDYIKNLKLEQLDANEPEKSINTFTNNVINNYMIPKIYKLNTIVLREAVSFPDLANEFHKKAPNIVILNLANFFEQCIKNDKIRQINSYETALFFVNTLRDKICTKALFNQSLDKIQIKKEIDNIVDIILFGILKN